MPDAPMRSASGEYTVIRSIDVTPETIETVAKILGISDAKKKALKPGKLIIAQEKSP